MGFQRRRWLYELVSAALRDPTHEHEVVNAVDVRRLLPESVAARHIQDGEEFVQLWVVER